MSARSGDVPAGGVAARDVPARDIAADVPDPELPMLTLADLGILRDVAESGRKVTVTITPTYSGCPALQEMSDDLRRRLHEGGYHDVTVLTQLSPPWTSDAITAAGRRKLAAAGIAPPLAAAKRPPGGPVPLILDARPRPVPCPRCGSADTDLTAPFGATACTALYRCGECREPFEHVKDI